MVAPKKCRAMVEQKKTLNTNWGDIVHCKRNAQDCSEFCYNHDPEKVVERAQKAYARRANK